MGSRLLFFRRGFTTAVLKGRGEDMAISEESKSPCITADPQEIGMGIGSNRQVVGFTWDNLQSYGKKSLKKKKKKKKKKI